MLIDREPTTARPAAPRARRPTCHPVSWCIVVLLALLAPAGAWAQAVLTGQVVDETRRPLPGVEVRLEGPSGEATATSDGDGRFRFDGVAAGPARLELRLIDFGTVRRDVAIRPGGSTGVQVVMRVALRADVAVTAPSTFRNIADVEHPSENLVGIASAASQGAVTGAQLDARPILRAGEVLESVPGMIVSQHSGEGKANQYYLRGFNLDHGSDFSASIAGIPINMPTGAHAHGYADANFLIPELVSGVQFKKGPYSADEGDFSAAGAAHISYVNALDGPIAMASTGAYGWGRVLAAASPRAGDGRLLAAFEGTRNDGPWALRDDYRRANGVLRYSRGNARNGFAVTGLGYWADWRSTDQVPQRAIDAGQLTRFGYVDPTDQGHAERQSVVLDLQRSDTGSSTRVTAYAMRNALRLFSNFTYFLDDPERGDQFEQSERRMVAGGRVSHRRLGRLFGRHTESAVGVQVRRDWIAPVGLYRTARASRIATTREDRVGQTMTGLFAQTEIAWSRVLRTTVGLRGDAYQYEVRSDRPENSGRGVNGQASPKLSVALGPWAATEIYANAGLGYHSNDARGAVTRVDPATGDAVEPVTPFVRARGAEVGIRTVRLPGLQSTFSLWYLGFDSELLFVGDAGTTEAGRPSRRIGIEWTNYARLTPWLTADADLAFSRARFTDDDAAGPYVPGSLDRVVAAGVTVESQAPLFGSVRVRHFGPRPLVEDARVSSRATTIWNGEVGARLSARVRAVVDAFNLFDAAVSDIDYYYRSRLPGEPADGLDDVHTHPAIPRTVRLTLRVGF